MYKVYLILILLLSYSYSFTSVILVDEYVINKIVKVEFENELIYTENEFGLFSFDNEKFSDKRVVGTEYTDTLTLDVLYSSALNDETIELMNNKHKLNKVNLYIAKNSTIFNMICFILICSFSMIICLTLINITNFIFKS